MKSVVVDRFSEAGRNFEIYSDGVCVVENATPGFIELSAETIKRIARVATPSKQAAAKQVQEPNAASISKEDAAPKTAEAKITRSIARLESGSWECIFSEKDAVLAEHTYSSREFARKGTIHTPVGKDGRLT